MDENVLKDTNENLEQDAIIALRKLYLKYGNNPIHWSTYFVTLYGDGVLDWEWKHEIAVKYVTTIPVTGNELRIEYVRIKPEVMDD